ncbi:MAG: hypothetical protein LBT36_00240 [Oscillospiraceae bacterium]|nr:hypothetical protein [Oscillospiraceae bacterium]
MYIKTEPVSIIYVENPVDNVQNSCKTIFYFRREMARLFIFGMHIAWIVEITLRRSRIWARRGNRRCNVAAQRPPCFGKSYKLPRSFFSARMSLP